MVDMVVHRHQLRDTISRVARILMKLRLQEAAGNQQRGISVPISRLSNIHGA